MFSVKNHCEIQVHTIPVCALYLIKYDTSKGKATASISNHFTIVKQGSYNCRRRLSTVDLPIKVAFSLTKALFYGLIVVRWCLFAVSMSAYYFVCVPLGCIVQSMTLILVLRYDICSQKNNNANLSK